MNSIFIWKIKVKCIYSHVTSLFLHTNSDLNYMLSHYPPEYFSPSPICRPKLKNVDRSTAQQLAITVGNVTVIITDFKEKTRNSSTSSSTVTSSTGSEQQHQSSGSESMDKGSSRASTPKGDLSVGHEESFWAPRTLSRPQGCTLSPFPLTLPWANSYSFLPLREEHTVLLPTHTQHTYTFVWMVQPWWTVDLGRWANCPSFPFLETSRYSMYCFIFVRGCAAESTFLFCSKKYLYVNVRCAQ